MTMVWDSDLYEGGTLLVLLAMADWAADDGTKIFPALKTLAAKARLSPRGAQYALEKLRNDGVIRPVSSTSGGRGKIVEYKIELETMQKLRREKRTRKGANRSEKTPQSETERVQSAAIPPAPPYKDNHQEPSLEPPYLAAFGALGDAIMKTVAGKPKVEKVKKVGPKMAHQLNGYSPDDDAKGLAIAYWTRKGRPDLIEGLEDQVVQFLAHHRGKGTKMVDWNGAWQTWYYNAVQFTRAPRNQTGQDGFFGLADLNKLGKKK